MKNRKFTKSITLLSMTMFMLLGFVGCKFYKTNKDYDKLLIKHEAVRTKNRAMLNKIDSMLNDDANYATGQDKDNIKNKWAEQKMNKFNPAFLYQFTSLLDKPENKKLLELTTKYASLYEHISYILHKTFPTPKEIKELDEIAKSYGAKFKRLYLSTKKIYIISANLNLDIALINLDTNLSVDEQSTEIEKLKNKAQEENKALSEDKKKLKEMLTESPEKYKSFTEKMTEMGINL